MRILVVAGSSGGHIFPATSFICALKERHEQTDTLLVLARRTLKSGISLTDYKTRYISAAKITSKLDFANLIEFLKSMWESLRIIVEFKPDIVVGFGGLDSIPCLFFAWLFRVKTMIHEQNVLPGRANRLSARFVDRIALSFEKTKDYFCIDRRKLAVTGNPLRRQLKQLDKDAALSFLGLRKGKFTVLVMGGSQGSRHVNQGFIKAVSLLKDSSSLQVIHLAGALDYETVREAYKGIGVDARVFDFLGSIEQAYSAADLAISRAGATTISELIFFKLPAILSPYPYAYAHQAANAGILREKGCAIVIDDEELSGDALRESLQSVIDAPEELQKRRSGFEGLPVSDSGSLLAQVALSLNN